MARLCRLARCTKVVSYLSYCGRAGRAAVVAVFDPKLSFAQALGCEQQNYHLYCVIESKL